jgi:FkbM family methyltransferase
VSEELTVETEQRSPDDLLLRRWRGPVIVSYAQNAEDVRLWRVFESMSNGFYVDVGAGDPVRESVTKLFYDAGWTGINIEPGPKYEVLSSSRANDVNLPYAISTEPGEVGMWITSPDPGLSSFERPPEDLLPPGFSVAQRTVPRARLDDVLRKHAPDRAIDFLKIDVEGAEREVLESLDLTEFRPTVVVAEAITPLGFRTRQDQWEPLLLACGYVLATFDGLNRFYVTEERRELVPVLDYPITVLDRYVLHDFQWRRDSSLRDPQHDEVLSTLSEARNAKRRLEELQSTLSWRVTRPLRAVRRLQLLRHSQLRETGAPETAAGDVPSAERAFVRRLQQATVLLIGSERDDVPAGLPSLDVWLARFEDALSLASNALEAHAWLALVAVDGTYPEAEDVDAAARVLRTSGPPALTELMRSRFERLVIEGTTKAVELDVHANEVIVLSEAMVLTDIHTGIQRVARECIARWLDEHPELQMGSFDSELGALKVLAPSERERVRRWRDHSHGSGSPIRDRDPEQASDNPLVPWGCRLVVTELLLARRHNLALATLANAHVLRSLAFICFDLIPIVAPETADEGLPAMYCDYLTAVKRGTRVSAISHQTARGFAAFNTMLDAEGLTGPEVVAHPLPTVAPPLDEKQLAAGLAELGLLGIPLVLVVGVHVPRKNHMSILEAAEVLWREGLSFELLFIGGYESRSAREFDAYLRRLRADGWPVRVRRRASEPELWAAYKAARFTVYPSLLEGFGLPVAESLVSGTPVVTTRHGSMAEIADGGGALLVDPRKVDHLTGEMRHLLTDDALLDRLRREARSRNLGSWDQYAREVWSFLIGEKLDSSS